jgi:hypothetical protein
MCFNPQHLEQVGQGDNLRDGEKTIAFLNGNKTHCKRGHEFTEENTRNNTLVIRGRTYQGRQCRICERMHGREYHRKRRQAREISAAQAYIS